MAWGPILMGLMVMLSQAPSPAKTFSQQFCIKLCSTSDFLCWFCSGIYDIPDLPEQQDEDRLAVLRPTKADLMDKSQVSFRQHKIVGGVPVQPGELPYVVSIRHLDGVQFFTFCGGALITAKFVVTAAHCVLSHDPQDLFAGLGDWSKDEADEGEVVSAITKIIIHPEYSTITFQADLALLELAQSIWFDAYKLPVAMIQTDLELPPDQVFNVSGWGTLSENGEASRTLRRATVPLVDFQSCRNTYDKLGMLANKILPGMICAGWANGGYDACLGDSGGPLVANLLSTYEPVQIGVPEETQTPAEAKLRLLWSPKNPVEHSHIPKMMPTLVGIVSWGLGCARSNYAGVYTDIRTFRAWILNEISPPGHPAPL